MDGCTVWAVEMGVDFDPDEAPSISELWLTLDGVTGAGADCSLTIHQEGVCGTGFYDFQNEDASWVTINTDDCPGVSGSDEGEFGAASGYLRIETIETDDLEMTQSGDPLGLTLAGYVTAVNTNLSISGAFAFSLTAPTTDVDGTPFCVVGDGDSDGDSYLDPYFGGDDCDGADASVSPGEAEDCSTMRDDNCDGNTNEECVLAYGSLSTATQYTGEAANDFAGWSVSGAGDVGAGDVNADGYDDVLVGARLQDQAGAAYLLLGSAAPASASLSTATQYTGEAANDYAGSSVSGAGDVNGDGYDDMFVGAPYNADGGTYAGAAFLLLGSAAPASASLSTATQYTGEAVDDSAGSSVSSAGDVDGDGYDDMLVGRPTGAAYLVLGSAAPASASLTTATQYTGEAAGDGAGSCVSGAGDVNGDGYDDMLVGAYGNDDAASDGGAAYLLLSPGL